MIKKKDEKKGKSGFVSAQSSRNPILGISGMKIDAEESEFSDVKTGHGTLNTEHQKEKIGPGEPGKGSVQFWVSGFQLCRGTVSRCE